MLLLIPAFVTNFTEMTTLITNNEIRASIMLITSNEVFRESVEGLEVEIDQEIFIYDKDEKEVHEIYTINGIKIQRKLGQINSTDEKFAWSSGINTNFNARRSNFYGITLRGVVQFNTDIKARPEYKTKVPYFPNNETYLVNDYVYGICIDVLKELESELNFTTLIFKRKTEAWGFVQEWPNGTFTGSGMVGDIFFKRADLVVTSLSIIPERAKYVDFLPPLVSKIRGIFIAREASFESIQIATFARPFRNELWIALFGLICLIMIFKMAVFINLGEGENNKFIWISRIGELFWSTFAGFFSGKPGVSQVDTKYSYKFILLFSLLCGTITWIYYRSYLSALFAVSKRIYPFHDLRTFSETNWR